MALEASASPRVLIVRRDNIGDLVCTTPLIDALRARHPRAWIGALVNTYNAQVLAGNPALDAVYAYEKLKHRKGSLLKSVLGKARTLARLRGEPLDCVLVPSATAQALRLAGSVKAKRVIAGDASPAGKLHEVERAFALGASLGVQGAPGPMRVYPDQAKLAELRKKLPPGRPLVAVHISARRPAQRWPEERFSHLINEIKRQADVILLWSPGAADDPRHPGDDAKAGSIAAQSGPIAVPTPDVATLVAALSLADRVVCPDGGAMHIAAALGKPVVALFGDSPVERWRPWGVPHRVVRPPSGNLADLPLEEVLRAYLEIAAGEYSGTQ